MNKYSIPSDWISYRFADLAAELVDAKAAVLSLRTVPYQKAWVEALQQMELKREVAGTSKIEGAEFTERELEQAIKETPEELLTRSQRQVHSAVQTYRWIATLPDDRPVDAALIREIHARLVTNADEDHCPPGVLRARDENVTFGQPRHRGAEGGQECEDAFQKFCAALQQRYRGHDPLIQALAAHYHVGAIHPFLDGNGRTARALEALMLQRANLRDTCFIAMSNYYYDEKIAYLKALHDTGEANHDLTEFIRFGLKGISLQSRRLLSEIQHQISKELFRNLMYSLFKRLRTPKKRVIAERQIEVLKVLLESESLELEDVIRRTAEFYKSLGNPRKAVIRDLNGLIHLRAIDVKKRETSGYDLSVRLEWPTEITETAFFDQVRQLPTSKTHSFLQ